VVYSALALGHQLAWTFGVVMMAVGTLATAIISAYLVYLIVRKRRRSMPTPEGTAA
jgi:hypothetical protein